MDLIDLKSFLSDLGTCQIKFNGKKTIIGDARNLILLKYLFQSVWIDALELIDDNQSIIKYQRKTGRNVQPDNEFYKIITSNDICNLETWNCTCSVFVSSLYSMRRVNICSHLLAIYIMNENYEWANKPIETKLLSHKQYCLIRGNAYRDEGETERL